MLLPVDCLMPTDCNADRSCQNTNEYNESPNSFEVMLFEYPKNIGKIKLHKWRDQVWNIIPKLIQFQKTAKVGGVGKIQNFKFGEWGYETKIKNSQN